MTRKIQPLILLIFLVLLLPSIGFSASSSQTMNPVENLTTDQLVGSWQLEGTAHKKEVEMNPEDQSWEFRVDGTLKSVVEDRRADGTISLVAKYKIENNLLLIERVGRSNRWKRFQVLELTDSKMVLKGGIEGYMYFKRNK
jgi:hypothetical protein